MECLIAFGTGIVGKIAEYTVEPVGRQVGYLFHYKSNFQNLRSQVRHLGADRENLQQKIVEEERKGRKVGADVNNWLEDVEKIIGEANRIFEAEGQGKLKCLHGFCPNLKLRYQLSRKSTKLVPVVVELHEKREFTNFASDVSPQEVWTVSTTDYEAFHSRDLILKNIMDELRNPTADTIGLYGIGGVGKTTLVKEVYRQAKADTKLFDDVVMVLDVKNSNLEIIQKEIAQQLGLVVPKDESIPLRARLCERVKDKNILVILDDILEKIDLESLGLPRLATCKILLTSRNRNVLSSDMGTQKEFQLQILNEEETWRLFEKMSGDVVKHPAIQEVATKVAQKCGGLPVLVVTVARALKNRNKPHAWNDALRRLKEFDKEEELTERAYKALEWSYDQLDDRELKPLFLLCGISAVWGNYIDLKDLLKYGMGLDLFKSMDTVEAAWDALHSMVEKLKDSCLLLHDDNLGVRMHDLVRDVANRIAFRVQHVLSIEYGGELKKWPNKDFLKKCTKISLLYGNIPVLPEVLECQELEMLHFSRKDDDSMEIPCNFFKEMKKLKVLDLTNHRFPSLPSSFQFLKNLQTLCLDGCFLGDIALVGQLTNLQILSFINSELEHLPKEIGQLTQLRLLDLSNCSKLEVISPNVISSLKRLEDLSLGNSFNKWEAEVVNERSNASLSELKHLSQLTALKICIPDANTLPENLFSDRLERYQIYIGDVWDEMNDTTLNTLKLKLTSNNKLDKAGLKMLLKRCEDLCLDGAEGVNDIVYQLDNEDFQKLEHLHLQNNLNFTYIISTKVVLPNLATLSVHGDGDSRFLLSSSMAKSLANLKHLEISACEFMEEIISTKEYGEENMDDMFRNLEGLRLNNLPNFTRFCTRSYIEFSSLKKLELVDCPKLGAFIIDPTSKNTTISKEMEKRDSKENIDIEITIQYSLFNEKVRFPCLEILVIKGLSKLTTIWHKQFAPYSFCRLRRVKVSSCNNLINIFVPSIIGGLNALDTNQFFNCQNLDSVVINGCSRLKNIFPATVARCLSQLQKLNVSNCDEVEEIVAREMGLETTPEFEFPKVTFVRFQSMPKLRSFYSGMHTTKWPVLKVLVIYQCDKVEIFATELSIFQEEHDRNGLSLAKESFFLIEKDSFPNLERLVLGRPIEIWNGPPIAEFLSKLKSFQFNASFSNQAAIFLQKLHNLETLELSCDGKEIFVNEVNGEIHAVGGITLPRVRFLELFNMHELVHVGNGNSLAAGPVLTNLEFLEVEDCPRLKIVESSAISFKNLTALQVFGCHGLEYLTTYSIAKSLMQLTRMKILCCNRMKGIVASNEEDAGNEISFSRLQHLSLGSLPSLEGFCSENYLVEIPSLQTLSVTGCLKLKISPELERLKIINRDSDNDDDDDDTDAYYLNKYAVGDKDDDDDDDEVDEDDDDDNDDDDDDDDDEVDEDDDDDDEVDENDDI